MQIEFVKAWKWFNAGQVADIADGRADMLCRYGVAKKATAEKPAAAAAVEEPKKPTRRRRRKKA